MTKWIPVPCGVNRSEIADTYSYITVFLNCKKTMWEDECVCEVGNEEEEEEEGKKEEEEEGEEEEDKEWKYLMKFEQQSKTMFLSMDWQWGKQDL